MLSSPNSPRLVDLCYSTGVRRGHLEQRIAITAETIPFAVEQLRAFLSDAPSEDLFTGKSISGRETKPVFVFSGMGPQWWGMARELLREAPTFRRASDECDGLFRDVAGCAIRGEE